MLMLKHIIAIILISLLVILTMPYVQMAVHGLMDAYNWINHMLTQVFSGDKAGNTTRDLIAMLVLPLAAGLVPAIPYYFAKRSFLPFFMTIVWVIWLVEVTAIVLAAKAA
jgi:hypothetical protein